MADSSATDKEYWVIARAITFCEGADAYLSGKPRTPRKDLDNPSLIESWFAGWDDAAAKHPG